MSYRDVTALRKSGALEQAIALAEEDLARRCDRWSCAALFWCLNEKIKTLQGSELAQTIEQMKSLAEIIGQEQKDEVVERILTRAVRLLIPHAGEVRCACDSSKTKGQAMAAYVQLTAFQDLGELDSSFFNDYGWVIYRALKEDVSGNVIRRKQMLNRYLLLGLERPSLLHSLILSEAVKIEKSTPLQFLFSGFLAIWDLNNLREEDWRRGKVGDGKEVSSLVEKMIVVYVKEMLITPSVSPSEVFLSVLDRAVEKFQDNGHLTRYKAQLLIKDGKPQEAIALYKQLLAKSPQKFYLWSELAELTDNQNLKIGLLCKALKFGRKEEFLGKIRVALAGIFCLKQAYEHALYELNLVRQVYQRQEWKNLPSDFWSVFYQIPKGTEPQNSKTQHDAYEGIADEYIYSDYPSEFVIKIGERRIEQDERYSKSHDRKLSSMIKWTLMRTDGSLSGLNPKKFALDKNSPNGTCLKVRIFEGQVVTAALVPSFPDIKCVRKVEGDLKLSTSRKTGKPFGFVGDNYVPEDMLKGLDSGCRVRGIAVRQQERWRLIRLEIV